MKKQFINLASGDCGRSIYRIVSCERFLQVLHDQENGLALPRLWDDPFENFILKGIAVTPDGKRAKIGSVTNSMGSAGRYSGSPT